MVPEAGVTSTLGDGFTKTLMVAVFTQPVIVSLPLTLNVSIPTLGGNLTPLATVSAEVNVYEVLVHV
jgi:hypothetical protein